MRKIVELLRIPYPVIILWVQGLPVGALNEGSSGLYAILRRK